MVIEVTVKEKIDVDNLICLLSAKLDKKPSRFIEIMDIHAKELLHICEYIKERSNA